MAHNEKTTAICDGGATWPMMTTMVHCDAGERRSTSISAAVVIICALIPTAAADAQAPRGGATGTSRGAPVLHEPLPAHARAARSDSVVRSGPASLADAIETATGRIDKPERPARKAPAAPLYGAPAADRAKVATDRQTKADGTLHYDAVFNPTVAPFKRDRVFDQVAADGGLMQSGAGLRPVTLRGAATRPGHELFWGHVTVEVKAGRRTPIPSIAPSSQLIQAEAYPARPLSFFRDNAGNFSVTSTRAGTFDLRFLVDAPSSYFAAPLGSGPAVDDPPMPSMPAAIAARMRKLWAAAQVAPGKTRKDNVERLTDYFRSFQPGVLDDGANSLLEELIISRKGVCRHRAHAFVAMAHSLGIPAHYVINDAHAFVEAWVVGAKGRGRWQRIDLGGGADTLRLHGADRKHLHDPLLSDPLPRPQQYADAMTQTIADGRLNDSSWAGARKVVGANGLVGRAGGSQPAKSGDGTRSPGARATAGATVTGPKGETDWLHKRAIQRAAMARNVAAVERPPSAADPSPNPSTNASKKEGPAAKLVTSIVLAPPHPEAYVGETLEVRGRLVVPGGGSPKGLPIDIWLVQPRDPTSGFKLGTAMTGKKGHFVGRLSIPVTAALGEFDLVAHFPGRGNLASAYSRR